MGNVNKSDYEYVKVLTLNEIMKKYNHTKIDLLKLDIEGVECEVLDKMLNDKIYPLYLSIDFDSIHANPKKVKNTIDKLIKNGYKLLKSKGQDYSFLKIK